MILERPSKGLGVEVTESKPFIEKNGGTETQGQSSGHLGENQAWNPRSLLPARGTSVCPLPWSSPFFLLSFTYSLQCFPKVRSHPCLSDCHLKNIKL